MTNNDKKRPLFYLALTYIIGLIFGKSFNYFPLSTTILILISLSITIFYKRKLLPYMLVLIMGAFYYQINTRWISANDISNYINQDAIIMGRIAEPVKHSFEKITFILNCESIIANGRNQDISGRIKISLKDQPFNIIYGDILKIGVNIREVTALKNPWGFDYKRYLERSGIRAMGIVKDKDSEIERLGHRANPILDWIYQKRERIREAAISSLSWPESALFQSMIIGETGGLTNEIRDHFMASGVTHILSISGSHLGLLSFVIFTISRWLILRMPYKILNKISSYMKPSVLSAILSLPPVIFYALIAGGEVATIRSLIMIIIYLCALIIERDNNIINSLSLSAIIVLIFNPESISDISFQLSYLSVLILSIIIDLRKERSSS